MATRGRKPKHPGLEVLDGGRGKRAQPQTIEIPSEYPACPPDFKRKELWAEIQTLFEENGVPVRSTDIYAIEELCTLIGGVREMEKTISEQGRTVTGSDRNPRAVVPHPIIAQLDRGRTALWRAFERFGMTPVDSSRLPLKSKTKTPREKVLEGFEEWNRKQERRNDLSSN